VPGTVPGAGTDPTPTTTGATAVLPQTYAPQGANAGWATVVGGAASGVPTPGATQTLTPPADLVEDNPTRRRWIQIGILAGAVIAAGLLIWGLFAITAKSSPEDPNAGLVQIPQVENLLEDEAVTRLENLDLKVTVEPQMSTEVEKDRAIGTDPKAGTEVEPGSQVTLFVSTGPDEVEIPTVRGKLQSDAVEALEKAGLVVSTIETAHDPSIESGRATGTDPIEGTIAKPGDEVTLYISDGQVELPDLVRKTEAEARQILIDLGLVPNVTYQDNPAVAPGEVVTQSPVAGLVPQRSSVTLTVAREPSTVTVPSVVGKTQNEANSLLQAAGLQVGDVTYQSSPTVPLGNVISQSPEGGLSITVGQPVKLVVSSGPAPSGT